MRIEEHQQGAVTVLRPRGQIVSAGADELRDRMLVAIERSLGRLVLDASDVQYVDSAGLEALLDVSDELGSGGRVFKVCGATETLREVMDLTGISDRFEHFVDVSTAARSFL